MILETTISGSFSRFSFSPRDGFIVLSVEIWGEGVLSRTERSISLDPSEVGKLIAAIEACLEDSLECMPPKGKKGSSK